MPARETSHPEPTDVGPDEGKVATRRRGPYAKTARTRERIVDACETLYAAKGFRSTTVKEIAELAGISDRGLVHHFPTREDLLLAVLERHEDRSSIAITKTDPLEALQALLAQERALERSPLLVELRLALSSEATDPGHPAHEHYARNYRELREYLTTVFSDLRTRGDLVSPQDDLTLAASFIAVSDGLHMQRAYDPDALSPADGLRSQLVQSIPALAL
ncbi:TetR/AcrR family transcriptional regulator [Microbacterium sp. NPDC089320]|uniref:TetR/AcrR family transcriptional regulator n=1 Tax=Microbacterium sp. NPDC089320 TaxID=3155182 RepID=UPI0034398BAB